jgi:NADH:ubiquinone reductase (non-electrogenic)
VSEKTIPYDYLVYAVGCENQTFGMAGVPKYACFLKELADADKVRTKLMDCIESAAFPGQTESEIDRLMHMVVVGGGPTGVEYAGELHDFLIEDLRKWYPGACTSSSVFLLWGLA